MGNIPFSRCWKTEPRLKALTKKLQVRFIGHEMREDGLENWQWQYWWKGKDRKENMIEIHRQSKRRNGSKQQQQQQQHCASDDHKRQSKDYGCRNNTARHLKNKYIFKTVEHCQN